MRSVRLAQVSSILILLASGFAAAAAEGPGQSAPAMNVKAPPLVLAALNGETIDLAKLHGKVVLVNYWATWCAPCRKEMPTFDAFYRRYHDRGLEIIGISIDFDRDIKKVQKAAGVLSYPVAVLAGLSEDGFGRQEGVPITYVIDTEGVVRDKFIAAPSKLLHDVVVPMLPHSTASGVAGGQ
jgi:cytochrome c biogenesis protein CcmG, thiol:disulfide interchange protein DsbE